MMSETNGDMPQIVMIRFSTSGRDSQSAAPLYSRDQDHLWDFVNFLAVAQKLDIDFLPITWQPALSGVGVGGTAEIQQSLISLCMSFAFKVFRDARWIDAIDESQRPGRIKHQFQALIAEISVLGQPSVREHPNVITLFGICWDILPSGHVWPVLVFEKTPLGDLWRFAESETAKAIPFQTRLKLCVDIATAVRDLHQCGIIHGDIKPQNVLIFKDDLGLYTAKVADFGYSTIFTGSGKIAMPKSEPWSAPERMEKHDFTFQEAQKMDAYSFGMLCLWLLLYDIPGPLDLDTLRRHNIDVAIFAKQLIEMKTDLHDQQKEMLSELCSIALHSKPVERNRDFNKILGCLTLERRRSLDQDMSILVDDATTLLTFSLVPSILQFLEADIRVRSFVAIALREHTDSILDRHSFPQFAFQMALCFKIGFGVTRDMGMCTNYLKKSQRTDQDLRLEVERLKGPFKIYQNGVFRQQLNGGYILTVRYPDHVLHKQEQDKIIARSRKELSDLQCELPEEHRLVLILKAQLANSLKTQHNLKEAEGIQRQVVESWQRLVGPKHRYTITNTSNLADMLRRQGKYKVAEELHRSTFQSTKEMLGLEHPLTITCMSNLAVVLSVQDKYELAERLDRQSLGLGQKVLGSEHPQILIIMDNLATTLSLQGKHEMAANLFRQTLDLRKKALGLGHPHTLNSMCSLACQLKEAGRYEAAESLTRQSLELARKWVGPMHHSTLRSMHELASVLGKQGKYNMAEDLARQTLESSKKTLGSDHLDTIASMGNLAATLQELGKYEAAEKLSRQSLELNRKVHGSKHSNTLTAQNNLTVLLTTQGKYKEAEELGQETLDLRRRVLGSEHPFTLATMHNVSLALKGQGKYTKAKALGQQTLELMNTTLGPKHPDTLDSMFSLSHTLMQQGNFEAAEKMSQQTLDLRTEVLGSKHPHTLGSMRLLVSIQSKIKSK